MKHILILLSFLVLLACTARLETPSTGSAGMLAGQDRAPIRDGESAAVPMPECDSVERAAVRRAALDYLEGFYEGDSTKLVRSVWPAVAKYGYYRPHPDSAYAGDDMAYEGFMRFARGVRAGRNLPPPGAPKLIEIFDVQDQTASAKATAWWGTDYLLLAKQGGRWMITHVLWQEFPPEGSDRRASAAGKHGDSVVLPCS